VKAINRDHWKIPDRLGATEIVFPERDIAYRLAEQLINPGFLDYEKLEEEMSLAKLALPKSFVGKTLKKPELPRKYEISVIMVKDVLSGETTMIPDPNVPLKDSDVLIIVGKEESIQKLQKV